MHASALHSVHGSSYACLVVYSYILYPLVIFAAMSQFAYSHVGCGYDRQQYVSKVGHGITAFGIWRRLEVYCGLLFLHLAESSLYISSMNECHSQGIAKYCVVAFKRISMRYNEHVVYSRNYRYLKMLHVIVFIITLLVL